MTRPSRAIALAALLAGCAGPQSVFAPAGDEAGRLLSLMTLMLWVCGVTYLLVLAFLAAALWRNRRLLEGVSPDAAPVDRGLKAGLVGWTVLITLAVSFLAVASFFADRGLAARRSADALHIRVTGQQWWWRIEYRAPSGGWIETANELHLPRNRPAQVQLGAADVIHSFWIPNLSGKVDMIPGRTNQLYLTPRQAGWFRGQCAEFCGLQHAQMALDVKVEEPAAFEAWLARQAQSAGPAQDDTGRRGQQLFATGVCGQCHSVRGSQATGRAAPDLTHVADRRFLAAGALPHTTGALMGWIAQPQAAKPGAQMPPSGLSPADTLAVVSYLGGLK